ncbi:MAG: hypothetical protein RRX92_08745 [Lachnospiraceae bacterium]
MKLSKKDKQTLLAFLGILLVFCTYFFLFQRLQTTTQSLRLTNAALQDEVTYMEQLYAKQDGYTSTSATMKTEVEAMLDQYATGLTKEDEIMYLTDLEHQSDGNLNLQYINMAPAEEVLPEQGAEETVEETQRPAAVSEEAVAADAALTAEEGGTVAAPDADAQTANAPELAMPGMVNQDGMRLFREKVDCGYIVTYTEMKNILKHIYQDESRKSIESIQLAFDAETGNLAGTMQMSFYYLEGINKEYQPASIPPVSIGTDNLFHSVDVMQKSVTQKTEEGDANAENTTTQDDAQAAEEDTANE